MFPLNKKMTVEQKREQLQKACQNGGWRQLKEDIAKYNAMREQVIKDMENQKDPLFRRYLKMYKTRLGAEEFLKNRLKIYAICNQRALVERVSVDEMLNELSAGLSPADGAASSDEAADHQTSD